MHTRPAAQLVGHDFLGNHIGELLVRQPIKRAPPPTNSRTSKDNNNNSSNGSTVCGTDSRTARRASVATVGSSSGPTAMAASMSTGSAASSTDLWHSASALDSFLIGSTAVDPVTAVEHSSEGSSSEPSSVDSTGSADMDQPPLLHLEQLSLPRKRFSSEGGPLSPRVTFVTNFGAKPRRSAGSRRAPSEAGSTSYFGLSSNTSSRMSSASMSPMEATGGINWNLPFREHNQSFAQAIEHNASLNMNLSNASSGSGSSASQAAKAQVEGATSTNAKDVKSKSFSGTATAQPPRQRLVRAATESTLEPIAQASSQQQPLQSPAQESGSKMSHSNSMGGTGSRRHRKQPSLVPKGDDERTFCFVEPSSSEDELDNELTEDNKTIAHTPVRKTSKTIQPVAPVVAAPTIAARDIKDSTPRAHSQVQVEKSQYTPHISLFPVNTATSSTRPARKLRIQPNVQSRPSLLERTMEAQNRASKQAQLANGVGISIDTPKASVPATPTPAAAEVGDKFERIAYGPEQRTFRIQSSTALPSPGHEFFSSSASNSSLSREAGRAAKECNARTSDWAREQNLLASSPEAREELQMTARSHSQPGYMDLLTLPTSRPAAAGVRFRSHTTSHSSSSTESPSILNNGLLSPPETAVSTPDAESPPMPELALPKTTPRRGSPLRA